MSVLTVLIHSGQFYVAFPTFNIHLSYLRMTGWERRQPGLHKIPPVKVTRMRVEVKNHHLRNG